MAIDREQIVNALTYGKAANGFIPDAFGGSDLELISTKANIAAANELLAGVTFTPSMKKTFTLTVENTQRARAIAEIVKASWESLDAGFTVNIEYVGVIENNANGSYVKDAEMQVLVKEAVHGMRDFDCIGFDWQFYSDDAAFTGLASLTSSLGGYGVDYSTGKDRYNVSGWNDIYYNHLVNTAYNANTEEERVEALEEAEKFLIASMPIVPLVFNETVTFTSSKLKKVGFTYLGNPVLTNAKLKNYKDYLPKED